MLDLLVVGGGPVGLATAIRARSKGMKVRLIDSKGPVIDKACGEGLMPQAARLLARLGVSRENLVFVPFRGIRYLEEEIRAEGQFPDHPGWGVRRPELHSALRVAAQSAGVDLVWRCSSQGLEAGGVRTSQGLIEANWIVAADGLRSPLRRTAGLQASPAKRKRFGTRKHFDLTPWTDYVEVYWADGTEAYVTPVGPREVGVAVLWEGPRRSWSEMLAPFPELQRRLEGAKCTSEERGMGPLEQGTTAVTSGNLALVGDAAGFRDAISGEGLAIGLQQAFAVVDAIEQGGLALYAKAHRRITRLPDLLTLVLMRIACRTSLRRSFLSSLERHPETFDRLLAVVAGDVSPYSFGLGNAATLIGSLVKIN